MSVFLRSYSNVDERYAVFGDMLSLFSYSQSDKCHYRYRNGSRMANAITVRSNNNPNVPRAKSIRSDNVSAQREALCNNTKT